MCIDFVPSMAMFKSGLFSINIIYSDLRKRILLYVLCKNILKFLQHCNQTLHITRGNNDYISEIRNQSASAYRNYDISTVRGRTAKDATKNK